MKLLSLSRSYRQQLLPFLLPYLIYVVITSFTHDYLMPEMIQAVKLGTTLMTMVFFARHYRMEALKGSHVVWALVFFPIVALGWLVPLFLLQMYNPFGLSPSNAKETFSTLYFGLRLFNSVVLVALFEELFVRGYLQAWFHQAAGTASKKGFLNALGDVFDEVPQKLLKPPISGLGVGLATLVFTLGHHLYEYPAAAAYFLLTTWAYAKSGSLWVCIFLHSLTNLTVALLVRYAGMTFLW